MIRLQQSGRALNSDILLTTRVTSKSKATPTFQALWAQINQFEQRFSRFLPDSELTQFNQQAGKSVTISQALAKLLVTTKEYSQKTGGLYNPFVLPALQRAGYVGSWPTPDKHHSGLNYTARHGAIDINNLQITGLTAEIPVGTALDFGGIGKGYLLDLLAAYLDEQSIKDYWLSLGGDIICRGYDDEDRPWKIGISNADQTDEVIASIPNSNGKKLAIATSGITKRRGETWHHIIDPTTQAPAESDLIAASVATTSAAAADVFAKCLVILGSVATTKFMNAMEIKTALLQQQTDTTPQTIRYGAFA